MAQVESRRLAREFTQVFNDSRVMVQLYDAHRQSIAKVLDSFESKQTDCAVHGRKKYMAALQAVIDNSSDIVLIDLEDFEDHALVDSLVRNTKRNISRYQGFFVSACYEILSTLKISENYTQSSARGCKSWEETLTGSSNGDSVNADEPKNIVPPSLLWDFQVLFVPPTHFPKSELRLIRGNSIGRLVMLECDVSKMKPVKPRMQIATYLCTSCRQYVWNSIDTDAFMPLTQCPTPQCRTNRSQGNLTLHMRLSKFMKYQEVVIQEPSCNVPVGSVPRSMTVICTGALTRKCKPGDRVVVTGIFLPTPKHPGETARRRGAKDYETFLEAIGIESMNKPSAAGKTALDMEIEEAIKEPGVVNKLANSIAPEIYGMLAVKKALLCLMVGGCTRVLKDGMRIRGDIHILLMGDPGVAKSQLLKQLSRLSPRSVYTTGKGTSGVGLTACVQRDPITNEVTLGGGALVMADKGICCIDEFDKMEEGDRTAIHEVMEQQTISIAKAGITTTLNARAAVLAAANPAYGRYNTRKTVLENLNLPAALLSRFDVQFLLLDQVDEELDMKLAKHVGLVHKLSAIPENEDFKPFSPEFIRAYIAKSKEITPIFDDELQKQIVNHYVNMRSTDRVNPKDKFRTYTTPRTLLATLRLSQAFARLRFSERVETCDLDESLYIIDASKASVTGNIAKRALSDPVESEEDLVSVCWELMVAKMRATGGEYSSVQEIENYILQSGRCTSEIFRKTLKDYCSIGVIALTDDGSDVILIE